MTDLIDLPVETAENRRLEEAHDRALEKLEAFWLIKYHGQDMYLVCDNDDEVLCEEAQDLFNDYYSEALEAESH